VALTGKGYFIWRIPSCENGDVNAIANLAQQAHFSHVLIKVADGAYSYNIDLNGVDLVPSLVQALKARGIQAWGWHYLYGNYPTNEADKAIQRITQLGLQGYALDVEAEYKQAGKAESATKFMDRLRKSLPHLPIALCSYRYPMYHPQIPWAIFLEQCDYNMPQVYWEQAHNPADQLRRCVSEFQSIIPYRPIIPVGSAYIRGSWSPTASELQGFLQTAQSLNLTAASFWEWANTRKNLPDGWTTISDYPWSNTPPPPEISLQLINALNTHDPNRVTNLYAPNAVHVTAARTIQGIPAIRTWYQSLLTQLLPNAAFTQTSFSGTGPSRTSAWTAVSNLGKVRNGNDTLGISGGKIVYHYTAFTITQ
jgi:hypothetical protein